MVLWPELTFLDSWSLLVYSLWRVRQAASSNGILVLPMIKRLDVVYFLCPFARGSSGALVGYFNYEK